MKKFILTGLICLFSFPWIRGQEYIPQITHRHYTSDSTLLQPRRPWKAALETFGLNMLVWSFDRYIVKRIGLISTGIRSKAISKRPGMGHRPVHNKPFLPPLSRFTLFQRSSQQRYELLAIRPVCSRRQSDVGVLYGE